MNEVALKPLIIVVPSTRDFGSFVKLGSEQIQKKKSSMTEVNDSSQPMFLGESLSPSVVEKLQAGAFRQLCRHLQERSDQVQNMDLMTLSGFCRNCLAKVGMVVP